MPTPTLPVIAGDKDRSLQEALGRLTTSRAPLGREADPIVTAAHRLPAIVASFADYPEGTDERLKAALAARGIDQLYTHQAAAIGHALEGRNVVIVTPTASGKTLCYNAPVLQSILADPSSRALYLFPTKALAQDQLAELHQLVEIIGTPNEERGTGNEERGTNDHHLHLPRRPLASRRRTRRVAGPIRHAHQFQSAPATGAGGGPVRGAHGARVCGGAAGDLDGFVGPVGGLRRRCVAQHFEPRDR